MILTAPQKRLLKEYKFSDTCPRCGEESLNMLGTACNNEICPEPKGVKPKLLFYCQECMPSGKGPGRGNPCAELPYGEMQPLTPRQAINAAELAHGEGIVIYVKYVDESQPDTGFLFSALDHGYHKSLDSPEYMGSDQHHLHHPINARKRVMKFKKLAASKEGIPVNKNLRFWYEFFEKVANTSL